MRRLHKSPNRQLNWHLPEINSLLGDLATSAVVASVEEIRMRRIERERERHVGHCIYVQCKSPFRVFVFVCFLPLPVTENGNPASSLDLFITTTAAAIAYHSDEPRQRQNEVYHSESQHEWLIWKESITNVAWKHQTSNSYSKDANVYTHFVPMYISLSFFFFFKERKNVYSIWSSGGIPHQLATVVQRWRFQWRNS